MDPLTPITTAQDELVELVWHDIAESLPRARVCEVISEISAKFQDATITAFIPIIVRRKTRERLRAEMLRESRH